MHKFASNIQKLIFSYLLTFDSWSFLKKVDFKKASWYHLNKLFANGITKPLFELEMLAHFRFFFLSFS